MTIDSQRQALLRLAGLYGVQAEYRDASRQQCVSPDATLVAALQALGAPLSGMGDAADACQARLDELARRILPPSHVCWDGRGAALPLRLPKGASSRALGVRCTLALESGEARPLAVTGEGEMAVVRLPDPLPLGYHTLTVEAGDVRSVCRIIAAPEKAYSPETNRRAWGVFLPLYALYTAQSWGAGDLGDLEALLRWTGARGGSMVGTLPLLAAFLNKPFDPSPYSPVSRLFWNELYLDARRLPELGQCAEARALLESSSFLAETSALREAPLVDYRRQMALKRQVLELLTGSLFAEASSRRDALAAYVSAKQELERYARFRAATEAYGDWRGWPARQRSGDLRVGDYPEHSRRYHLYAQWAMEQQMDALSTAQRDGGPGLYLDLPLGVHPQGYDAWRWQDLFVNSMTIGAPPDALGPEGQEWGIAPLHPERLQGEGMDYIVASLRCHMRHARALRLDHVMGLHRLFWIPRGMKAGQGVYVDYPAEALYAAITLESHRWQTEVIGEDLGTVPPDVRPAMARHGLRRMYVAQFELTDDASQALRPVPAGAAANLNTHDTPTFAGFCRGADLELRLGLGALDDASVEQGMAWRQKVVEAAAGYLRGLGLLGVDAPPHQELFQAVLRYLGESEAGIVMVNLEDLWGETRQQNLPGTTSEHPNWRQKARYSLEQMALMPQAAQTLAVLKQTPPYSEPGPELSGAARVVFSLRLPEARTVALAGDFNAWDTQATPLMRRADGLWQVTVALPPGMYQYKYLVDGLHWLEDPSNPLRLPNPFSGYNSMREVLAQDD